MKRTPAPHSVVVILFPVGKSPRAQVIDSTLGEMQRLVGGYVECVRQGELDLWVNDDAIFSHPFNRVMGAHGIHGQFFMARRKGDQLASVTNADLEAWVADPAKENRK